MSLKFNETYKDFRSRYFREYGPLPEESIKVLWAELNIRRLDNLAKYCYDVVPRSIYYSKGITGYDRRQKDWIEQYLANVREGLDTPNYDSNEFYAS